MVNRVTLIGNLGADPEFNEQYELAKFSLATSETWKDKEGNKQEQTEWHNCVVFGKGASIVNQYCRKGSKLYIEGQIQYRDYEKDNDKKHITQIKVNVFKFLDGAGKQSSTTKTDANTGDDLPFN